MVPKALRFCLYGVQILFSFICLICASTWISLTQSESGIVAAGLADAQRHYRVSEALAMQANMKGFGSGHRRLLLGFGGPTPSHSAASLALFTSLISLAHSVMFLLALVRPGWGSRALNPLTRMFKGGPTCTQTTAFVELLGASLLCVFWFATAVALTALPFKPDVGKATTAFAWLALLTCIAYGIVTIYMTHASGQQAQDAEGTVGAGVAPPAAHGKAQVGMSDPAALQSSHVGLGAQPDVAQRLSAASRADNPFKQPLSDSPVRLSVPSVNPGGTGTAHPPVRTMGVSPTAVGVTYTYPPPASAPLQGAPAYPAQGAGLGVAPNYYAQDAPYPDPEWRDRPYTRAV